MSVMTITLPVRVFLDRVTGETYEVSITPHICDDHSEEWSMVVFICTCDTFAETQSCSHTSVARDEQSAEGGHFLIPIREDAPEFELADKFGYGADTFSFSAVTPEEVEQFRQYLLRYGILETI